MPILKKIFSQKDKSRQDSTANRHTTSKITLDPASAAILSKPFLPLDSRAMSPSDLLDSVGHPMVIPNFRHSSPDLSIYSSNTNTSKLVLQEPKKKLKPLKVRNLTTTPPPQQQQPSSQKEPVSEQQQSSNFRKTSVTPSTQSVLLLETSREDKTLVEEEKNNEREIRNTRRKSALAEIEDEIEAMVQDNPNKSVDAMFSSEAKKQFDVLQQRLLEFEYERDAWQKRLQGYIVREEQMRKVIQENQLQISQLRQQQQYLYQGYEMRASKSDTTSRHNSHRTASTRSSTYSDDDYFYDDIQDEDELQQEEEREIMVDDDDEGDLVSPTYYNRRQYGYYPTPINKSYPYYQQAWKNYYYDPYYGGGYR